MKEKELLKAIHKMALLNMDFLNVSIPLSLRPQDLVSSFNGDFNNEKVLKIAILLQSLDDQNSSEYLNIPQSTKDKITLTTLDNLSIEQLNQAIIKMGFTP
ncbi:MAG: Unknown protein, partial [uncultured Sulfurovum sp.]